MTDEKNVMVMAVNSLMFYKAAEVLDKVLRAASEAGNTQLRAIYFIPHIVNKSFAVEMAMKAILTKEGIACAKTHRLDELFISLPSDLKEATIVAIKIKFGNINYDDEIRKIGNAFVEWRYFHEKSNSIEHDFFNVFADVVCQICYQLCNITSD